MKDNNGAKLNVEPESLRSVLNTSLMMDEQGMALMNILDDPLEEQDLMAVDALMEMIDFDPFEPEMHNQLHTQSMKNADTVQECDDGEIMHSMINDSEVLENEDFVDIFPVDVEQHDVKTLRVPFQRETKVSKYLQSPCMDPPASTPQNHKMRARLKNIKKRSLSLIGPDGNEISAWTEDLSQDGTFVYSKFWESLLGISKCRSGWLSDTADADWAMAKPFFSYMILNNKMPCYFTDSVPYGLPSFAESVKKVYFPINEDNVHLVLEELHIRSSVITIYDSLGGRDVEDQDYWLGMGKCFDS
ncbi:ulp1 protease family, C-terminal catalytic domain-containing protein [Tanacetum coccineum]